MAVRSTLYNIFLKRNSAMVLTAMCGAFMFERAVDVGADTWWESHNKGKLWKDVHAKLTGE